MRRYTMLPNQRIVTIHNHLADLQQHWSSREDNPLPSDFVINSPPLVDSSRSSSPQSSFGFNTGVIDIATPPVLDPLQDARRVAEEATDDVLDRIIQDLQLEDLVGQAP